MTTQPTDNALIDLLYQLPDRGWGVLRAPALPVGILWVMGFIRVSLTEYPGVYHARLTGPGRLVLAEYLRGKEASHV